jgi:phosphoglycerate dehydrogenase-like enzyme
VYFINIARGRCVVTQDLIAALQSGQFAGAGLDVVDPEPLPADSPLWGMPNVLITPHVAILGSPYCQKWQAILLENYRRFAACQPLLNVVDKGKWF